VWIRNQVFGLGGSALSLVGVTLVGLSIWSGVKINVSDEGFQAEFNRLQEQVKTVAQSNQTGIEAKQVVTQEVKNLAENTERAKEQFAALTNALEAKGTLEPDKKNAILKPVQEAPRINLKVLDGASEKLKAAAEKRAIQVKP
jgi:hypothetical protein